MIICFSVYFHALLAAGHLLSENVTNFRCYNSFAVLFPSPEESPSSKSTFSWIVETPLSDLFKAEEQNQTNFVTIIDCNETLKAQSCIFFLNEHN